MTKLLKFSSKPAAALVALLTALTLTACTPERQRWNVLLVLVDTLRADHLGLYGYHRPTSPELERFAEDAVLFRNAYSQAACTFPSVNSILTSRHPVEVIQRSAEHGMAIAPETPSLAEILKAAGYAREQVDAVIDLYDEEILFFDQQFKLLLDDLERREILDNTLIVVMSDHGEALLENGDFGHCRDLVFESLLATPLILRVPGLGGLERDHPVRNLDVLPTLLDYLGVDYDEDAFDGRSLRQVIESDRPIVPFHFAAQGDGRNAESAGVPLMSSAPSASSLREGKLPCRSYPLAPPARSPGR